MAATLVLIELDRQQVKRPSLHAITLARQLGDLEMARDIAANAKRYITR